MKKTCLKTLFITIALLSLIITPTIHAASLTLTHIGALTTNGATYSEWWYTGTNPVLRGTADSGAEVKIAVNSDEYTVSADSSGNWSYQTSLSAADYSITISSEGEQYAFTLHAGQGMPGDVSETTQSTVTTPPTGYNQVAGILGGLTLLTAGVYAYKEGKKNTKEAYVDQVMKSLD